jgi:hypothetical protein
VKAKEFPASLFHSLRLRFARAPRPVDPLPVRVTLTSIPSRLQTLDIVIKSLLLQSRPPERVHLWLHEGMAGAVPARVRRLVGSTLRIGFVHETSSHNKLVHAVRTAPDAVWVTCDDDMIYPADWLQRLWQDHLDHPGAIIANDVRAIRVDADGAPLPYAEWGLSPTETRRTDPTFMGVGWAGVLYPPGCFHADVTDASRYLELTPSADDLWFKAMSHLVGTPVYRARSGGRPPIPIPFTQRASLKRTNVDADRNRGQWAAVAEAYGIRFVED